MKKIILQLLVLIATTQLFSCKKSNNDSPKPEEPKQVGGGDEEVITRVQILLTDSANTSTKISANYNDNPRTVDTLRLNSKTTYLAEIKVFNDTKNPVDTISNEIEEEANYHRFHYSFTTTVGSPSITTLITDRDTQTPPLPLGLTFKLKVGNNQGKGVYNVNLRHFGEGLTKTDDPKGGEQDILLDFPVIIK